VVGRGTSDARLVRLARRCLSKVEGLPAIGEYEGKSKGRGDRGCEIGEMDEQARRDKKVRERGGGSF